MSIIIILGIICLILYFLAKVFGQIDQNERAKRMESINKINDEYEKEIKKWCTKNNVIFKENITETKEIWVNQLPGYIWFSGKDILFCPDSINCGNPINIEDGIMFIKYNSIKYYTKDGAINYTNEIIDEGKNISISGAIVGGLIAGDAGAVIGSRKDMNKIKNVTVEHDDVCTYIYFEKDNEVKLAEIKGSEFYQRILHLMPEKEYHYIINEK